MNNQKKNRKTTSINSTQREGNPATRLIYSPQLMEKPSGLADTIFAGGKTVYRNQVARGKFITRPATH